MSNMIFFIAAISFFLPEAFFSWRYFWAHLWISGVIFWVEVQLECTFVRPSLPIVYAVVEPPPFNWVSAEHGYVLYSFFNSTSALSAPSEHSISRSKTSIFVCGLTGQRMSSSSGVSARVREPRAFHDSATFEKKTYLCACSMNAPARKWTLWCLRAHVCPYATR